jgi:hypothetical protein
MMMLMMDCYSIIITINDYGMDDHLALFFFWTLHGSLTGWFWIILALGIMFEVLSIGDTWRGGGNWMNISFVDHFGSKKLWQVVWLEMASSTARKYTKSTHLSLCCSSNLYSVPIQVSQVVSVDDFQKCFLNHHSLFGSNKGLFYTSCYLIIVCWDLFEAQFSLLLQTWPHVEVVMPFLFSRGCAMSVNLYQLHGLCVPPISPWLMFCWWHPWWLLGSLLVFAGKIKFLVVDSSRLPFLGTNVLVGQIQTARWTLDRLNWLYMLSRSKETWVCCACVIYHPDMPSYS